MTRLNQIIAVEAGVKNAAQKEITSAYHTAQKPGMFEGRSKVYNPLVEGGIIYPSEVQAVLAKSEDLLTLVRKALVRMIDVTATKDTSNRFAIATVVVDGEPLLINVPSVHLLFLKKQLVDLRTFVATLPTLDPQESWNFDPQREIFVSEKTYQSRVVQVPTPLVKYEATDKHPAQVDMIQVATLEGTWINIRWSGAQEVPKVRAILERIDKVLQAVAFALEEANSIDVRDVKYGDALMGYIFG